MAKPSTPSARHVKQALEEIADPERALASVWFFKTGPGEYGEGDEFIGVTVPLQRKVAKQFRDLELEQIDLLLKELIHEFRLTAIFILVDQFKRAKSRTEKAAFVDFLIQRTQYINNWDLVDSFGTSDRRRVLERGKGRTLAFETGRIQIALEHALPSSPISRSSSTANSNSIRRSRRSSCCTNTT